MKKKGYIILGIIFLVILIGIISSVIWYNLEMKQPNKNSSQNINEIV